MSSKKNQQVQSTELTTVTNNLETAPPVQLSYEQKAVLEKEYFTDFAKSVMASGLMPSHFKTPEQAFIALMLGKELGIGMMTSLNGIFVIEGKASPSSQLLIAQVWNSGGSIRTIKDNEPVYGAYKDPKTGEFVSEELNQAEKRAITDRETVIEGKRYIFDGKGNLIDTVVDTVRFTKKEAADLKLLDRNQWQRQFGNMLYWRCAVRLARRMFPDKLANMYSADEMADLSNVNYNLDSDGNFTLLN